MTRHLLSLLVPKRTPRLPSGVLLEPHDAHYMIRWLFWQAANPSPPNKMNQTRFERFRDDPTNYKLFNHVVVDASTKPVSTVHTDARVGKTVEPIVGLLLGGQEGQYQGRPVKMGDTHAGQVNDGTPHLAAVHVMNRLALLVAASAPWKPPPRIWNNIGSKLVTGQGSRKMVPQCYPTYYVYNKEGGEFRLEHVEHQKPDPVDNFTDDPYHHPRPAHVPTSQQVPPFKP